MKTQITQIAKIYNINMNIETVTGVEYDGITEYENGVYNIKVNENANDETYTHEFGHVIINEINMNNPTAMNDIANVLMIGNDEVLADIIGNLVYQYEFGETPRDMTYVFANENDLNFVIDTVVENMMN